MASFGNVYGAERQVQALLLTVSALAGRQDNALICFHVLPADLRVLHFTRLPARILNMALSPSTSIKNGMGIDHRCNDRSISSKH